MNYSSARRTSSSSERRNKSSRRSAGSPDSKHRSSRRNRRKDANQSESTKYRSRRSQRDHSQTSDEEKHTSQSKRDASKKKKDRPSEKENKAVKLRQKKKQKSAKARHYQSAPDLTETDRQYGKGPWQRTHMFFDEYSHRPQSWMQEMAQGQSAAIPTPVMERQIIYSVSPDSAKVVDGLGYPLRERSPGFQPVPYETYLMPRPARPHSLDMTYHQSEAFSSLQSQDTSVKLPVGAVPALGPRSPGPASAARTVEVIIPERGYEVQAHVPNMGTASLPAWCRNGPSSIPPTYKTPPQYASSTLPRNKAPTPKPRTKSPTKEMKPFPEIAAKSETSPKQEKEHRSKITAVSAREDFESLLASEYDMSKMKMPSGDFSEEFPPPFLGNYRPNQEIFVDDVIFRKHPDVKADSESLTDSDVITDEEHVLTLGEELSPNSVGYSSGYDLEIPEGFCFDSEGVEKSSVKGQKRSKESKKKRGSSKRQQEPDISRSTARPLNAEKLTQRQKQPSLTRSKPLVLGAVTPVSQREKTMPHDKGGNPKQRTHEDKRRSRRYSSSPERQETVHQKKSAVQKAAPSTERKKMKSRKVQHPSNDDRHERIITISKKEPHSIRTGILDIGKQKSAAGQAEKPVEPPEQPVYFLKPISSQEVFIEATRSETDFSPSQETSTASSRSNHAGSTQSLSDSSSVTSEPEHTGPSEVESSAHDFQRNSELYASTRKKEPIVASSVTSFESEKLAPVRPTSMVIGVSESIQASSYTGKGGKVFCLTRSRHGSSPTVSKSQTDEYEGYTDHSRLGRIDSEYNELNAHEVGKWVLDCYAHDQKLTTKTSTSQELPISPREDPHDDTSVRRSHGQLTKQQAVEFEGSFQIESEGSDVSKTTSISQVAPLTEALSKHEAHPQVHTSGSHDVEESTTELSVDLNSDLDVFRKELIRTRKRIIEAAKENEEPEWKLEEYKAKLKQWNNSPTSNVVLAEVCSVNDEDFDPPRCPVAKEIHPKPLQQPPTSTTPQLSESTNDTASQSTLSSESDEDAMNSAVHPTSQSQPVLTPISQARPQLKPSVSLQKSGTQHGGLDRKDFEWQRSIRPSGGANVASQPNPGDDWRIVSAPKQQPRKIPSARDINDNLQQDPFVPRAQILKKSADSAQIKPANRPSTKTACLPDPQPAKPRSVSVNSDSTTCSSQVANPFNKMDEDEIESLVDKIPGRGTLDRTESEENILLKLERSRQQTKRESLEERTARILGIYRKTSEDESDDSSDGERKRASTVPPPSPPAKTASSNVQKIDMNTYMNNLLTGIADVSPASRKKFFLRDMIDNEHGTSPLATTSSSGTSSLPSERERGKEDLKQMEQPETSESSSSDVESSDDATITETFSVNVSDSVMEANIDCKVKFENGNRGQSIPPKEYKLPENMEPKSREPMSPTGRMMLSYGKNIYAETPGFHKQQPSLDSTESEELELVSPNEVSKKASIPRRAQESPLPISAISPPLTEEEIDIVRQLVQNHPKTASQDSGGDSFWTSVNGTMNPTSALPTDANRLSLASTSSSRSRSWSPSREVARNKIAKSIGFTLPAESPAENTDAKALSFSPDEYDIKILSADRRDIPVERHASQQDCSSHDGGGTSVENVMESVGLDPSEAWLLSV